MAEGRLCGSCGGEIDADARFCRHCGAEQSAVSASPAASPPPPEQPTQTLPRSSAADRVEQTAPGADDFAAALLSQLSTPAVVATLIAGAATAAVTVVAGLLVAVATTASSIIGGVEASVVDEAMLQACALVGAAFSASGGDADIAQGLGVSFDIQTMPVVGLAVPIGAMALAVRRLLPRTADLPLFPRVGFAFASALPFALLMIIPATIAQAEDDGVTFTPDVGAVFGLSLLFGAIGAAIGARELVGQAVSQTIPRIGVLLRPVADAARALVIAIALASVVMTGLVFVQTLRDAGDVKSDRSTVGAAVENSLYAVEHGVHGVELGTFARFDLTNLARAGVLLADEEAFESDGDDEAIGLFLALPVEKADELVNVDQDEMEATYRIFDYENAMPSWAFILWVVILIPIPFLLALYAGFSTARTARAEGPAQAALWGALAGPVWAVALVLLNALVKGTELITVFGHADGDSVLGWTFLVATVAAALGGLLATRSESAPPPPTPAPR